MAHWIRKHTKQKLFFWYVDPDADLQTSEIEYMGNIGCRTEIEVEYDKFFRLDPEIKNDP